MSLRHWSLLWILGLAPFGLAAQEAVNLDELSDAGAALDSPVPPARSLTTTIYGDFDLQYLLPKPSDPAPTRFEFVQNHRSVLLESSYEGRALLATDLLNPSAYFTLTVLGDLGALTFGLLPVPFGEFTIHHIYGGIEDEAGVFLPKLWTDLGISYQRTVVPGLTATLYAVNGFSGSGGEPDFNAAGGDAKKAFKALGTRWRWDVVPGTALTASWYEDGLEAGLPLDRRVHFAGLDGSWQWRSWGLKAGGLWGSISVPTGSFVRWADYGEVQYRLVPGWTLRLRGGQMDPDSRVDDGSDQWDVNAGILWKGELFEVDAVYFHHVETFRAGQDLEAGNRDKIMVKFLASL